jgi:tetratricopeptide (TPR) repeat protein
MLAEAFLLLGDSLLEQYFTYKKQEAFRTAVNAFNRVIQDYPSNRLAAVAAGRIGDGYFQDAATDPKRYERATNAWHQVIELKNLDQPVADLTLRSKAEVAIGLVHEKLAALQTGDEQTRLLKQALTHYLNVALRTNVLPGELADPYWVNEAGKRAVELAEKRLKDYEFAANLCARLAAEIPALRASLEPRIEELRVRARENN